jgi:hypothetical protein
MAVNTINLQQERDLRKILAADVDLHFKIVKILCNQLGWRVEFNSFTASRYSLFVPLLGANADVEQDRNKLEEEEQKDNRPITSQPRAINKNSTFKGDKYFYKDNYEQLDQVEESNARPYSAQVPHLTASNIRLKNIGMVKEDPLNEDDIGSPTIENSTRTLGMNSEARQKLRSYVQQTT